MRARYDGGDEAVADHGKPEVHRAAPSAVTQMQGCNKLNLDREEGRRLSVIARLRPQYHTCKGEKHWRNACCQVGTAGSPLVTLRILLPISSCVPSARHSPHRMLPGGHGRLELGVAPFALRLVAGLPVAHLQRACEPERNDGNVAKTAVRQWVRVHIISEGS